MGSRTVYVGFIRAILIILSVNKRLKDTANFSLNYHARIPYLAIARQA